MTLADIIAELNIGDLILADIGIRVGGRIANILGGCVLLESGWTVRGRDGIILR
jgi:hypothetical protein